jgi:hypothetical protein
MAFPTVVVTPGVGQTINTLPPAGQDTMANSLPVTVANNQSAIPTSLAALPALVGGTATIGGVVLKPSSVAPGQSVARVVAAASTNATNLKASAGNLLNVDVFNVAAYTVFLKLYDKASAPTVGTDTPVMTIPIPASTGFSREYLYGRPFATGIAYAITKLQADSDTTVLVAGDATGSVSWI